MNEVPPPVPPSKSESVSMRGPWIAWLVACVLLPALPFLLMGEKAEDGFAFVPVAMICQFAASIWLALRMSAKLGKGSGFVVLMTVVFMIASVIIGTVSFFAACVALGKPPNFH